MTSTADAASALLASNRRRRRIRRWIAIGTLPLTIFALFFVGKILSMYAFAHQSVTSYVVDDYSGSEAAARNLEFLNWFEPYKAPFNVGTALGAADTLPDARAKLEEALELATGLEVCGVRINLAIVIERMGDAARAAGEGEKAAQLYGEALTITLETPEECNSEDAQKQSSDPDRDMSESLEDLEDRLQEKQQNQQNPPPEEKPQEPEEKPSDEKLEDLKEKLEQGTQERDQRDDGEDPGGSGTEKPW